MLYSLGITLPVLSTWRGLQLLSLFSHYWEEFGLVKIKLLQTLQFIYLPNTCAMTNATKAASFDLIIAWESLSKSWGWLSTVCFVCEFPSIFLGSLASDFLI